MEAPRFRDHGGSYGHYECRCTAGGSVTCGVNASNGGGMLMSFNWLKRDDNSAYQQVGTGEQCTVSGINDKTNIRRVITCSVDQQNKNRRKR